jgi:hypothetical protein
MRILHRKIALALGLGAVWKTYRGAVLQRTPLATDAIMRAGPAIANRLFDDF